MPFIRNAHRFDFVYKFEFPSCPGSIREGGGAFAKKERAQEDQYFRQETQRQLDGLKTSHAEEIKEHEKAIKRHQEAIDRHKKAMDKL